LIKNIHKGKIGNVTIKYIEIEPEHVTYHQKPGETSVEVFKKVKYRVSFVGPYIEGYFNIETNDFRFKNCYIYQYINGRNKGYCDLCDKKDEVLLFCGI